VKDLDAHLYGPRVAASGTPTIPGAGEPDAKPLHVYHLEKLAPGVRLDVDDKDGYGPETITLFQPMPGEYRYHVVNYIESVGTNRRAFSRAAAVVRVYYEDKTETFQANPSAVGAWWHVFDLDIVPGGGIKVRPVGQYGAQNPEGDDAEF